MSEVKKWYIGVYGGEAQARPCSPAEFEIITEREGRHFVLKEDYDSAAQCFLTAAEGCVAAERRERALQQRLTEADERQEQAVTTLNEIARVSRMGEKPFEIATMAIGEMSAGIERPTPIAEVPDGYCIMPRQLTAENGAKALLLGEFKLLVTKECPECCELEEPVEGCSICDGEGEYGQKHTIPWDQIKFIYSKAVSGLAMKAESAKT